MNIKLEKLEKSINSGILNSIYLLYGNEKYLIENIVKRIKKQFGELVQGINYIIIDETNVNDLTFNIETPAFGYDKKLIIVKNSGLFHKDGRKKTLTPTQNEVKKYLEENISIVQEMTILVFLEDEVAQNEVFDVVEKYGIVCKIDELKQMQLVQKLSQVCKMYKVNADNSVLNYLIETAGTNLQVLMNEIRKLIEYAGEGGNITRDAIDSLTIKQIESVIFDLIDDLGSKKIDKAIEVLDNLIYQKEPLQKILITLYNHFKKLYLCKIALNNNKDIVTTLGLKPNQTFLVNKYKRQASFFKESELKQILYELIELDYEAKNGLIDVDVGVRSVLCGYI